MKKLYDCIAIKDEDSGKSTLAFNAELLEDSAESAYITVIRSLSDEDAENMKNIRIYIRCLTENEFNRSNSPYQHHLSYGDDGITIKSYLKG